MDPCPSRAAGEEPIIFPKEAEVATRPIIRSTSGSTVGSGEEAVTALLDVPDAVPFPKSERSSRSDLDAGGDVGGSSFTRFGTHYGGMMNEEERLRRKLAFFFMNPVEKFVARRRTPWKLMLQFAKVVFVTAQLVLFGNFRYAHTNYYSDSRIAFEHLFFKNWDSVREIVTYPPATGKYALYNKQTFYKIFDDSARTLNHLEELSVAALTRNSSLEFCLQAVQGLEENGERSISLGSWRCLTIPDEKLANMSSKSYLEENNFSVPWDNLQAMYMKFSVRAMTLRSFGSVVSPQCFLFRVYIKFDNSDHDGQMPLELVLRPERLTACGSDIDMGNASLPIRLLNWVVIATCFLSLLLCLRALIRAQVLKVETQDFFAVHFRAELDVNERLQFLNIWYVVICINDVLIVIGSVITELIETHESSADLWDFCCVFLGTGDLLVWIGMLRYLGFFEAYNVLILTLKGAMPSVARFTVCAAFIYAGYTFCGWLVFSPYHFKFRSLQSTSECLFSLVNGDDMFATFSMMSGDVDLIHSFSRVYLYTFVMLFIYVILSLFVAIIMDTYENIKKYYSEGFPKTRVDEFYSSVPYDPYSTDFYDGSPPGWLYTSWSWSMSALYGRRWRGHERMTSERTGSDAGSSVVVT